MRIAICTFQYCFEISPLLKGIASYLIDKQHDVMLLTDSGSRVSDLSMAGLRATSSACNYSAGGSRLHIPGFRLLRNMLTPRWQRRRQARQQALKGYAAMIREHARDFDLFIVCEDTSLQLLLDNSVAPTRMAVLLLEGLQGFLSFLQRKRELLDTLRQCCVVTAASQARATAFMKELGGTLPFTILPVAIRESDMKRWFKALPCRGIAEPESDVLRLIHSGYFAPWAMIDELISAFPSAAGCKLTLHGHQMGTEKFMAHVRKRINSRGNIRIDENFYQDEHHIAMLKKQHCGIACYRNSDEESEFVVSNWSDMIQSSGKIATYLWCSLPVITNIDLPATRRAPFVFLPEITQAALGDAIEDLSVHLADYRRAAYQYALDHYNLDRHLDAIFDRNSSKAAVA